MENNSHIFQQATDIIVESATFDSPEAAKAALPERKF